ncbi:MAG: Serine/threonine-protein kinase pkn1 [Candidatus Hydrogenedentes bacterium ADurb.Bin179]|nr:MAG: Serine/threonine-protein kinase pkn1 [Candidatus Hydrogenedentes bacterium ADurb.Bin179]
MHKHALIIGIDQYKDAQINELRCAENDAYDMADLLRRQCGFVQVECLCGNDATFDRTVTALDTLGHGLCPEDLLLLFFSGHGYEDSQHGHMLLLYDTLRRTLATLPNNVLHVQRLEKHLTRNFRGHFLFLLDACRSNLDRAKSAVAPTLGEVAARDISTLSKGASSLDIRVLCACKPGQQSFELAEEKHGAFTLAFTRVARSRLDRGEAVAIAGDFVEEMETELSDLLAAHGFAERQQPWLKGGADKLILVPGSNLRKRPRAKSRQVEQPKLTTEPSATQIASTIHRHEPGKTKDIPLGGSGIRPLELVYIPAGAFIRRAGSEKGDASGREVILTRGFWMGSAPVTQAQWYQVMEFKPSHFKGDPDLPVEWVNWIECQRFMQTLSDMVGPDGQFRLPTEAEWEYACRAGTNTKYYFGDESERAHLTDYAWYASNSGGHTHPVMEKAPNAWGLHDITGNVFEWCLDWYGSYDSETCTDPQGPANGRQRVLRGGSWNKGEAECSSHYRAKADPGEQQPDIGLRVVLPEM